MTAETDIDFSILQVADIPHGEFAKLCGVTRVTVNHWVNKGGRSGMSGKPNRFIQERVVRELDRIKVAVDKDLLPVAPHIRYGKGHFSAVQAALAQAN